MRFLFYNSLSIICVIGAVILSMHDKDGWGWFIFLAIIAGVKSDGDKEQSDES